VAASAILAIKIVADAKGAGRGFDQASTKAQKFGKAMQRAAVPAAIVGAALVTAGKRAVTAASDQEQAYGGLDAVYGKHASVVKESAKTAAASAGMSATAYAEMAAQIGGQLKSAGVPIDKVAGQTDKLIKRGADLATTYGGTTADAVNSLSSAFRGEFDSSERLNVGLSAATVQAELVRRGQDKLTGAALAAAKVQATQALIYKNSGDAAGQFAQQTDSLAEKQQIAQANMENTAATLGAVLLPVVGLVTDALADLAGWMGKNAKIVQVVAGVVAGLAAVILVITGVMRAYAAVQAIVNAVMAANPAVLITLAIIALVAVVVIAYKKSETFRKVLQALGRAGVAVFRVLVAAVRAYLSIFVAVARGVAAGARAMWRALSAAFRAVASVARSVAAAVRAAWSATMHGLSAAARAVSAVFRAAWSGIRSSASAAVSAIRSFFSGLASTASAIVGRIVAAFRRIVSAVRGLNLPNPFAAMAGWIDSVIGRISDLIGWLSRIKVPHIDLPGGKSGPAASSAPAVASAGGMTARGGVPGRSAASAGAGGITINVSGALDPDAVARQIEQILRGRARRVSGPRRIGAPVAVGAI
jgi:phage-related protein